MAGLAVSASPAHAALECGDTITTDRTLHRDLECELDGNGLRIDGDDVTLDLNGHTISNDPQDDGSGILVGQSDGVRVVGGKVRGFNIGVNVGESTDVTVKDVNIRRAKGSGLFAAFANHVRFLENTVRGPSANGVTTQDSTDHIKIAGNDLSGVGIAIDGDDHKVIGNEISSPVGDGIAVLGGGGTELERNGITDAEEGAGIALNPAAGEVRVDENTVGGAEFGGIVTSAGAGPATIVHNSGARRQLQRLLRRPHGRSRPARQPGQGLAGRRRHPRRGRRHADRGQPGDRERPARHRVELGERLRQRGEAKRHPPPVHAGIALLTD